MNDTDYINRYCYPDYDAILEWNDAQADIAQEHSTQYAVVKSLLEERMRSRGGLARLLGGIMGSSSTAWAPGHE